VRRRGIRARGWLATPVATAVLLVCAALCVAWIPSPGADRYSDAGAVIDEMLQEVLARARTTWCRVDTAAYVVLRRHGGIEIHGEWGNSMGDALDAAAKTPSDAMTSLAAPWRRTRSGVWALTTESTWARVTFDDPNHHFSPAEIAAARALIAADLLKNGEIDAGWAERLAVADIDDRRVLLGGYAQNAATFAAFVLLLMSLRWVPALPARVRVRRLGRSECPRCRYSIVGNASGLCPECGTSLTPEATPPH
jgi:hypothetical protein